MARLKIGLTPEELQDELIEKEQQLAEEVLKRNQLREKHLQELLKLQKRNRIITISSIAVFFTLLTTFGIYNTFIKRIPTENDFKNLIQTQVKQFNVAGLDGFIRNNFTTWFTELHSVEDRSLGIEYVKPKLDSITIDDVVQISNTVARTYFSVDIETKTKDIENADKSITKGVVKTTRYRFYIPVENYVKEENGVAIAVGFRPASSLSLYMQERVDTHEVGKTLALAFEAQTTETSENVESAKIKVDRTLSDLYEKKDTSQDLYSNLTFNGYGSKYVRLDKFEFYTKNNALGYNAKAVYTIKTQEGFIFQQTTYLAIRKNGNSWRIAGML